MPTARAPACDARVFLDPVLNNEASPLMSMLNAEHVPDRDDGQDGQGCHQTGRQDGRDSWLHRQYDVVGHAAMHNAQGSCKISWVLVILSSMACIIPQETAVLI